MFDYTPYDVATLMQLLDVSAVLLMIILVLTLCLVSIFVCEFFWDWFKEHRRGR